MRKYFIFGLIFIAVTTLFVYIENNSYTQFHLLGVDIDLPNAVWVALFLTLFFIFSIIFLSFVNLKSTFFQKNVKKDIQTLIKNIKNRILYIDQFKDPKVIKEFNGLIKNINGLEITPEKVENFEFLEDLKKLKNGEVIEISKYKLKPENPWFILNVKNRMKKEPSYAREVLKKFKNEELKKEAFYIYALNAPVYEILKYPYDITFEIVKSHINKEDFEKLLPKAKLTPREEIEIAKALYGTKDPDSELELIKPLKWGWAYLAIKYSHFELAKEIVEENNLKFFEYYLNLEKKDDVDEYIDSQIC